MTPHDFDVICVGNARIDSFLTLHEANDHLRFIEKTNELCIKFGEKILVDKAEILLGGDAANVSVGLSRLGLKASLIAEIGLDEFSQKITNTLLQESVDTSNILKTKGEQSSFSTIINFKGDRTIFSEYARSKHDFNFENTAARYVYLTSVGEVWEKAYEKTLEFVKKIGCHLVFNPGILQIAAGVKNLTNVLSLTNILIVNKEEAQSLLQTDNPNIETLLKDLQKLGPKIIVITDGKNGSFAIDEMRNIFKQGVIEVNIVERTGAGDAYSSGFLAGIINNLSIADAMVWGTKNSASVVGKVGAQPGLLHKIDLEK